ncbi:MAG TPA: alpha/beta hydrolase [Phycisphaerae bacterium]|nr:alpha/beta hydrolase [Phycisphaerae bacterium]
MLQRDATFAPEGRRAVATGGAKRNPWIYCASSDLAPKERRIRRDVAAFQRGSANLAMICLVVGTALSTTGCSRHSVGLYEVKWLDNIEYSNNGPASSLALDIALPRGLKGPKPLVVWIHGGGWVIGSRKLMRPLCEFTTSLGYVSATISYRLARSDVKFPLPVHDVTEAVQFLRKNARKYRIDPEKIVIGGESAGGHLALMVGLCDDPEIVGAEPLARLNSPIRGIVNIYAPTELTSLYESSGIIAPAVIRRLLGCKPDECPETYAAASPVTYLRPTSPPILVLHGNWDSIVPYQQSEALIDACRKSGAPVEMGAVRHAEHAWVARPRAATAISTLPLTAHFLGRVFAGNGSEIVTQPNPNRTDAPVP